MRCSRRLLPAAARFLAVAAFLAAAGLGCSTPQSYIVLLLASSTTPIANIATISVVVSQGTTVMQTLTYPAGNLVVINNSDAGVAEGTLSVSFSGNQSGDVKFMVTALDIRGCAIGSGAALISIIRGQPTRESSSWRPSRGAPVTPVRPICRPAAASRAAIPAVSPAPRPSPVNSIARGGRRFRAAAGTSAAGGTCSHTTGCAAGSQCFDYSSLGCGTQLCLQFCATDADCAALGDGGVGPGSFCRDPVACGGVTTAYRTCSFSCDPTAAAATAARTGCPAGLACVIPSSMDHVDCSCAPATRTGKENTPCTSTAQCAPGFLVRADLPRRLPLRRAERRLHRAQRLPDLRHDLHLRPQPDALRRLFVIASFYP